ncbi:hypothetical protein JB92DRAFT_2070369 [Gautieria morchelliformis]|nr:hypothetical protein JB92DRAFT_2070369 [Gautieria morchelliformis]
MIASFDSIAISLDNPEQFSRVFLIILELWVALDKTAVEAIPLLRKYSPEFSIVSFEPLLLPTLCQMRRLRAVETHLSRRHADAIYRAFSFRVHSSPESLVPVISGVTSVCKTCGERLSRKQLH